MTAIAPTPGLSAQPLTGTPVEGNPLVGQSLDQLGGFDLPSMDLKIQKMHAVENAWDLPKIPDEVKYDLATQNDASHHDIGDFLFGLWHDVTQAASPINPLAAQPAGASTQDTQQLGQPAQNQPAINVAFDSDPNSVTNRVRRYWAGIAGLDAPQVVDSNSVVDIKNEAIRRGLLPDPGPGQRVDGTWSPQMRNVQAQMLNQDFSSRIGGDRPGAVNNHTLAGALEKWLTPSGLLKAATKLDLLPDVGNIVKETQSWGAKWSHFIHHPTPAALGDALTGPIDDLAVPIINDFLLLSGVSEAVMFARGADLALEAGDAGRGLYSAISTFRNETALGRLGGLGRAYDVGAEATKFAEPSYLSRIVGHVPGVGEQVSSGMQAWRDWSGVQQGKKALQTGMKLGVASNLEHLLLPGYKGGVTIGDVGHWTGFDQYTKSISSNPLTHGLQAWMDVSFAPPTVFGEGAVSGTARSLTDAARSKFLGVTRNERLTAQIGNILHSKLLDEAGRSNDPVMHDLADRVTHAFQHGGPSAALEEFYGSKEQAGAVSAYLTAVAGVDSIGDAKAASRLGGIAGKQSEPAKWRQWNQFFRNKAVAQLSHFDENDMASYAAARAFGEANSSRGRLPLIRRYLQATATDQGKAEAVGWIRNHQELRNGFWNDLLDNVNEGSLRNVVDSAWPTIGNWDKFTNATTELQQARAAGLLSGEVRLAPARSQLGRDLVADDVILQGSTAGTRSIGQYPKDKDLNLSLHLAPPGEDSYTRRWTNPLATPIDPDLGRFTVAARDTATKQDALQLAHYSDWLLKRRALVDNFEGTAGGRLVSGFIQPLQQKAADLGLDLHTVDRQVMNSWIDELAGTNRLTKNTAKSYAGLARWASENGISDMHGLRTALDQDIAAISTHPIWSDTFGVGRNLKVDAGKSLLHAQVRELRKVSNWLAAEVDTTSHPELAAFGERLGNQGYKLVHGVQFVAPHDIADLPGTFEHVTAGTMRRISLGGFFDRQEPEALHALRDRAVRSELAGALTKASANGHFVTPSGEAIKTAVQPESSEVGQVVDALMGHLRSMQGIADSNVEDAFQHRGFMGRLLARASNRGLPFSLSDMTYKQVAGAIAPTWGDNLVPYVRDALAEARRAGGFKTHGLVQIENNLRAHDNVGGILQVLGRTPLGTALTKAKAEESAVKKGVDLGKGAFHQMWTPSAIVGGTAGAGLAGANTDNNPQAVLAGAVGGAVGLPALKATGFRWLAGKEAAALAAHPTWSRYTHMADGLAHLRDELRFHLNPFFDMRRYTKGFILSQMHEMPAGVDLPLNLTMKHFVRQYGDQAAGQMRGLFKDIGAGKGGGFDPDILDDVSKAWRQEGLLGYNPSEYMTAMFGHLVKQGVDPTKAYDVAKKVYSYGASGRSAAEQSVNFIFFPFSFEKKLMTSAGKFITHDLSRAQMLHDGLKLYETLDGRYDLTKYWDEHLPLLHDLQKLNAFSHGLSPGELGGINRPLIETALNFLGKGMEHAPVLNAFLPQGVSIGTKEQGESLTQLMTRMLPIRNDMGRLLDDTVSQGHVLFSPSHKTEAAETDNAWTQATELKDAVDKVAMEHGHPKGIRSVMAAQKGDSLYALKQAYEGQRQAIAKANPAWQGSIDHAIMRRAQTERELRFRRQDIEGRLAAGTAPKPGDISLEKFINFDTAVRAQLTKRGVSIEDHPELVPSEIYQAMRDLATEYAQQDPAFLNEYRRFYARTYGPIQKAI